jgi:hypothetical protein
MTELRQVDLVITRRITPAFREGDESIDLTPYESPIPTGRIVDVDIVMKLLAETETRYAAKPAQSDTWLGPRLHAALRLTRAEAATQGIWSWLALGPCASYIRWRWSTNLQVSRFVGSSYDHGLARLWWMAELFRNGSDYTVAEQALSNRDIAQNFLRMDIAHHRPTCQAFMRVPSRRRPGRPLTGREANALAKAANCAATTLVYDVIAPDLPLDGDARRDWIQTEIDINELLEGVPQGPPDPKVPDDAIGTMTALMTELFADAPIRDDKKTDGEPAEGESDDSDTEMVNLDKPEDKAVAD